MGLWGRKVVVSVGQPGAPGVSFDGLRVSFRVAHTKTSAPSAADITVWNLRPETIALFQAPGAVVRLLAGYGVPLLIFQGNPVVDGVKAEKRGVDRVMTIKAQDGLVAYQGARVDITYATETTLVDLFSAAAVALGLPLGPSAALPDVRFADYTYQGDASDLLDRIAEMGSVDWTIRDGALTVIGAGETTGETAVLYSATAGNLVGSPARKDGGIEVTALLDASMRPGMPFVVQSAEISGEFSAEDVVFVGDSGYAQPFYTVVTGVERSSAFVVTAPDEASTPTRGV